MSTLSRKLAGEVRSLTPIPPTIYFPLTPWVAFDGLNRMLSAMKQLTWLVLLSILCSSCRTPEQEIPSARPIFLPSETPAKAPPEPVPTPVVVAPAVEFIGPPLPPDWKKEFRVAALFSHNMVLQQDVSVPIWGWADDGEKITVTFRGQKVSTVAKDGRWTVRLRNLSAGGPHNLSISGSRTVELTNVMVGEVWLCSGQSNMEWPLKKAFKPEEDIASATNTMIRLFIVPNTRTNAAVSDVPPANPPMDFQSKWLVCSPDWAAGFSAVGYYFGRDLQQKRKVPIGLIQSDWGGTPAEAWMNEEFLAANPRYKKELLDPAPAAYNAFEAALAVWEKEKAEASKNKVEFRKLQPRAPWRPAELYNGMIAPLIPYAIRGAIWYQGESNASRAEQYHSLFPDLIRNWRRDFGQGDFPFLCVQLAPFKVIKSQPGESDWAELREAQLLATKVLPQVGMAVITDVGEEHDIHPTKKEPVGKRLARAAEGIAYGEKIVYSGPIYRRVKFAGGRAIVSFDHVGRGLISRGGSLKGFTICGPDKKFYWALAEIQPDNTVAVWSPNVAEPIAVRFGWADYPVVNLWNEDALPASPFRTDDFPMITDSAAKP